MLANAASGAYCGICAHNARYDSTGAGYADHTWMQLPYAAPSDTPGDAAL
jgi:hypothetical protein